MRLAISLTFAVVALALPATSLGAPTMLAPNLEVDTVASGLTMPTTMAFLGPNDFFVLEKNTGIVKRVTGGTVTTVLDLAVNSSSERGLLGIALHPQFPLNPGVYLYWTCQAPPPPLDNPFFPTQAECADTPQLGADTGNLLAVPLLGNRVDRFEWNGSTLTFDHNLVKLRVFQHDGAPTPPGQGDESQPPRGNHDGGPIAFGPDGKLYVVTGDVGRRGQLQNLPSGPTETGLGPTVPDDQFGGPEPDAAHFTGAILRLNDDGTTPADNPFSASANPNLRKTFGYGIRNSFGLAFDPISGRLWESENGDSSFDEINLVEPGFNGGWIQIMGPVARIAEFKAIETSPQFFGLQQLRWPPTRLADSPAEALARLFSVPGSAYSDPEFSWRFAMPPAGIGFVRGRGLGPQYAGDLFVGMAVPAPEGGPLFHFNLTGNRRSIAVDDPRLADRVADNTAPRTLTESESLLIGRDFGVVTDIETGPNGHLFVVSLSNGAVYEISRA